MPFRDPDVRREWARDWMRARREEFFHDKQCVQCGSTDRLELDHIDPARKVSHKIWSWSKERRDRETNKCQVLCHDCHVLKTAEDRFQGHGTLAAYRGCEKRPPCRCSECKECHRQDVAKWRAKVGAEWSSGSSLAS